MTAPTDVLLRATTKARALRGRTRVVKLGGSAMEDPAATAGTLASLAALQTLGVRLVLVHGGGKPIDRAMQAAGLEPKKVLGRRYTDDATLGIVVRVLKDEINAGLVRDLSLAGASPVAVHTGAGQALYGGRLTLPGDDGKPIDLGHVGTVTRVDQLLLADHLTAGLMPVVPSIAESEADGGWLNVNADTAAAALAGAVSAEACLFLTDTPGVLRDIKIPASRYERLTRAECEQLIRDGVIAGGMIPKVEACFDALAAGAGKAVILDGRNPHALLAEFVGEPAGTEIVP